MDTDSTKTLLPRGGRGRELCSKPSFPKRLFCFFGCWLPPSGQHVIPCVRRSFDHLFLSPYGKGPKASHQPTKKERTLPQAGCRRTAAAAGTKQAEEEREERGVEEEAVVVGGEAVLVVVVGGGRGLFRFVVVRAVPPLVV